MWSDTGLDVGLNTWNALRLDWDKTSNQQSLYLNGGLATQGSLMYGTGDLIPNDATFFAQWQSSGSGDSQTLNFDNMAVQSVPEPAAALLLVLGSALLAARRR